MSKVLDEETGFYYFGARYLDPKYSRWLSGDPAVTNYMAENSGAVEEKNIVEVLKNNRVKKIEE